MRKNIFIIGFIVFLYGCASKPISVSVGDPEFAASAKQFQTSEESAKVYFLNGRMGSSLFNGSMTGGAIFLINNQEIGQIDKEDVLVADIYPNTYKFSWKYPSDDSKHIELTKNVKAGDVLLLEPFWDTSGLSFGLIGALLVPAEYKISEISNKTLIEGRRVVRATSCPQHVCKQQSK